MAGQQTFWDHLDDLRITLFRIALACVLFAIVAFVFKDLMFSIVFAPQNVDFVTYRWLQDVSLMFGEPMLEDMTPIPIVNYGLAQQFVVHVKTALYFGFLCASPYVIYQLYRFVSPALYVSEKSYVVKMVSGGYVMFVLGVLLCYYLIFPLTYRFLGTYQVSDFVVNTISLDSYMDTLLMMCLLMGIVFEIPILSLILARVGLLSSSFMSKYRRHAIILILVVAAVITPTSDIMTLLLVSFPMYILFEISILLVKRVE